MPAFEYQISTTIALPTYAITMESTDSLSCNVISIRTRKYKSDFGKASEVAKPQSFSRLWGAFRIQNGANPAIFSAGFGGPSDHASKLNLPVPDILPFP